MLKDPRNTDNFEKLEVLRKYFNSKRGNFFTKILQ